MKIGMRITRAPRGSVLSHRGWPRETALRMLVNSFEPDVAGRDDHRVVFVWATREAFRDREDQGLTRYGRMTSGSWIYFKTQGILQDPYAIFTAAARRPCGARGVRIVPTAGLGRMSRALALASTKRDGTAHIAAVDRTRIAQWLASRDVDESTTHLDDSLDKIVRKAAGNAGNRITAHGQRAGAESAFDIQRVVPEYVRPLFSERRSVPLGRTLGRFRRHARDRRSRTRNGSGCRAAHGGIMRKQARDARAGA